MCEFISEYDEAFTLYIRALDEGKTFQLQAEPQSGLDVALSHQNIETLLPQLLLYNYHLKFGTWEYHKDRGDLRFAVEIPLEDAKMTLKQFEKIIFTVQSTLEQVRDIRHIITTGESLT